MLLSYFVIQNNKKTCPQGPEFNGLIFLENALIRDILKCHFLFLPVWVPVCEGERGGEGSEREGKKWEWEERD